MGGKGTPFALQAAPAEGAGDVDAVRYDGPHGPIAIPLRQEPDRTRVVAPGFEAEVDWGMGRRDVSALKDGVAARIGGRRLRVRRSGGLSREGRAIRLEDDGHTVSLLRLRGAGGEFSLERADGERVGGLKRKGLAGWLADDAGPDDVAFLLLAQASGLTFQLSLRLAP